MRRKSKKTPGTFTIMNFVKQSTATMWQKVDRNQVPDNNYDRCVGKLLTTIKMMFILKVQQSIK